MNTTWINLLGIDNLWWFINIIYKIYPKKIIFLNLWFYFTFFEIKSFFLFSRTQLYNLWQIVCWWFRKTKLDFQNKKIKINSNLHEFFYELSNHEIGASENNMQLDIKANKKELITNKYLVSY